MKSAQGFLRAVSLVAAVLAASFVLSAAQAAVRASTTRQAASAVSSNPSPKVFYATGRWVMASSADQPDRAKAYRRARNRAEMRAVDHLTEKVRRCAVLYSGEKHYYLENYTSTHEKQIDKEVSLVMDDIQVSSERTLQDTIVEVKVCTPIPKRWQALEAKEEAKEADEDLTPGADPSVATSAQGPAASASSLAPSSSSSARTSTSPYSCLIIDAVGLHIARSMSPKILRADGSEVWGTVKVDYDFVADQGIVAYTRSLAEAYKNARAGDNPLLVKAIDRAKTPFKDQAVISNEDADYLLSEAAKSGFLKDFRVIFVIDPSRF